MPEAATKSTENVSCLVCSCSHNRCHVV